MRKRRKWYTTGWLRILNWGGRCLFILGLWLSGFAYFRPFDGDVRSNFVWFVVGGFGLVLLVIRQWGTVLAKLEEKDNTSDKQGLKRGRS